MLVWIITAVVVLVVVRIVYLEVRCGRNRKDFFKHLEEETSSLARTATANYRARYGRDPTAPFIKLDDRADPPLPSKKP